MQKKRNKWGNLIDEEDKDITHEWHSKDMSNINFYHNKNAKIQDHLGDKDELGFNSYRSEKNGHKRKICLWCKYGETLGEEKASKIAKNFGDIRKCPTCDRKDISSFLMEEE